MAWYQIFLANLLAAVLMFWFMWRRHPALRADIDRALTGTDDYPTMTEPRNGPAKPTR
jgi:hypothetical protein